MEKGGVNPEQFKTVSLPNCLSVKNIPEENRPNESDWIALQGGEPTLVPYLRNETGDLLSYKVFHNYENKKDPSGTGAEVITSLYIAKQWDKQNPYIGRKINNRIVYFPVAKVWSYHGKPCLEQSQRR